MLNAPGLLLLLVVLQNRNAAIGARRAGPTWHRAWRPSMRRAPREPSLAVGHGDQRRRLASAQAIPGRRAATALQRTAAAGTLDLAGTKAASSFTHTCPVQRRLEDAARAAAALPATQASRRRCAVGRVVFPPLLSASADGARSPDDRLHSAIVQLLKRRRSRPKHECLSTPPRQPLQGQPPGGDPPPRSPGMPPRQPPSTPPTAARSHGGREPHSPMGERPRGGLP